MRAQDVMFFMPKTQSSVQPAVGDCTQFVCSVTGGSNVGTNCDVDMDTLYAEACVFMARCHPANPYAGGCGTGGTCTQIIPTVSTSLFTNLIYPTGVMTSVVGGTTYNSGQIALPTTPTLRIPVVQGTLAAFGMAGLVTGWHWVACLIPAGQIKDDVNNVVQLQDQLTLFKQPTDALVTTWYQYQVSELRFSSPQMGTWTADKSKNFAGGQKGDIIVLKKNDCNGVASVNSATYQIGNAETTLTPNQQMFQSARFTLIEGGRTAPGLTALSDGTADTTCLTCDVKGGVAGVTSLAIGKVNELAPGVYKICYASASSEGNTQSDFMMLDARIEILPTPATKPAVSAPRSVILGQDIVVSWASNQGLSGDTSVTNSWIGLFPRGACKSGDPTARNRCYSAAQFIADHRISGTVIFSQKDYKAAGEYEVRYFKGNSRNIQGEVCDGLIGVSHGSSVACGFVESATSESITILGQDISDTGNLGDRPGLEAVFGHGNQGRYHRKKLS